MIGTSVLAAQDDLASLSADRTAIERVYYQHRLGTKPPFEQLLPPTVSEQLVKQDLRQEAALSKAYGVEITPAMLEAEVQRINNNTRAPDVLAELKAALGNDPARFARAVARPIVVERTLHERFDNDDQLHSTQRWQTEQARNELLALLKRNHADFVSETTWQLGPRPVGKPGAENLEEAEIRQRFGPNAQIISSPREADKERKCYFEDLPGELQKVLQAQLRRAGDVSAVIETPGGFLLYLATEKTCAALSVAVLSLPKSDYEQWLADQASGTEK